MGRVYRGPEQPVPEQVQGWADPRILALLELAERVDVSGFEQDYRADRVGGLPYDPRLMLVTVWWCHHRQWRGPQEMARACREQASLRCCGDASGCRPPRVCAGSCKVIGAAGSGSRTR